MKDYKLDEDIEKIDDFINAFDEITPETSMAIAQLLKTKAELINTNIAIQGIEGYKKIAKQIDEYLREKEMIRFPQPPNDKLN